MRTLIRNGHVFDTETLDFTSERTLVIEDGWIVEGEKGEEGAGGSETQVVDADGGFVPEA